MVAGIINEIKVTKFVDELPRKYGKKFDWDKITSDLQAHPGQWGVLESENASGTRASAQAVARNVRKGLILGVNAGEYEATTRSNIVYARYVGKGGGK